MSNLLVGKGVLEKPATSSAVNKVLKQRVKSAAVMLLLFLLLNFVLNDFLFAVGMSLLAGLAGWEWSRLSGSINKLRHVAYGFACTAGSLVLTIGLQAPLVWQILSAAVLLFWVCVAGLFYSNPVKTQPSDNLDPLMLLTGFFLFGSCVYFSYTLHTQNIGGSPWLFMTAMCTVWVMDVGAYFVGKRIGRTKLAPLISPGKTWEGVFGGLLCAAIFAILVLLFTEFAAQRPLAFILASLFAAGASILGDLYESRLKRAVDFKDSSQLIPGHGGILDRVDGVIAAIPVFAFFWIWL